jgi:hypothetical protein
MWSCYQREIDTEPVHCSLLIPTMTPARSSFAAIVLESHDVQASLEQSVRLRTTQLEQALTHRQTFISSITHEVRVEQ